MLISFFVFIPSYILPFFISFLYFSRYNSR
nr:MAG TPA: hypothetical protein [Caudoviricetes sp.]DAS12183.1 MAG TPA: hypothetical protein [Caudoviricetes sp.]